MKSPEALRTIGEVSRCLMCQSMCLDSGKKINLISPIKKKNGIRYYDKYQIQLIETLKKLLYKQKYSIKGANDQLSKEMLNNNEREKIIKELKELILEINEIL